MSFGQDDRLRCRKEMVWLALFVTISMWLFQDRVLISHLGHLRGFKPWSIFLIPLSCIISGGASDFRLFPMEGMLLLSSLVKTDANWSFRISALLLASE